MTAIVPTPTVPINFVEAKEGEIITLGLVKLRVMEDGSRTGMYTEVSTSYKILNTIAIYYEYTFKLVTSSYIHTLNMDNCIYISFLYDISIKIESKHTLQITASQPVRPLFPPKPQGPPPHWHEMHDETFLVTKGTVRFRVPEAEGPEPKTIDVKAGDFIVVPPRAPHTFSNETDEEARFFNTFTPVA
jgi:mannose-6-phosphate isomerase-like protein (cupin superfamily)